MLCSLTGVTIVAERMSSRMLNEFIITDIVMTVILWNTSMCCMLSSACVLTVLCRPPAIDNGNDVVIKTPHTVITNVTRLQVRGKSPTVYEFNLTVTDQHNLSSWDSVLVTVTKGELCLCVWSSVYECV